MIRSKSIPRFGDSNGAHRVRPLLFAVLFLPLLLPVSSLAQDSTAAKSPEYAFHLAAPADLVVANRPIITLRAEVFGNKPAERVANIHERLDDWFARNDGFVLRDSSLFGGKAILINGSPLLFIAAQDIDPLQGESLDSVVDLTRKRLDLALKEYDEMHDSRAMFRNLAWVVLYTVLFIVALWLLMRLRRWVRGKMEHFIRVHLARGGLNGVLDRSQTLRLVVKRLVVAFIGLIMLMVVYFWLTAILGQVPITRAWSEQMSGVLVTAGLWIVNGIVDALPGLALVVFIFLAVRAITRLIGAMFDRIGSGELEVTWMDANIAGPVKRLVIIMVWLFAVVIAYPYIPGSESKAFQGLGVLAGLMLSLGSSSLVSQAASGMVIMFNRVIRVGEAVAIGDGDGIAGVVKRIGYFNTIIVTGYGEEITVPNTEVLGNTITNRSRHDGKGIKYTTAITIGYDAPWRQVHAMMLEAAAITPDIAKAPAPIVLQHALSDFYVDYRMTFVIEGPFRTTLSALHAAIQDVFNANGVQIMSPHYEADPNEAKVVPKEKWDPGINKE